MDYERAKYAELFAVLFIRTGSKSLKHAFKTLKAVIDIKSSQSGGDQTELYSVIDFYLRCSLEVTSLIRRMHSSSRKPDFFDDEAIIMWGVHSRTPTLDIINGVLSTA